jgi:hypothetical protein
MFEPSLLQRAVWLNFLALVRVTGCTATFDSGSKRYVHTDISLWGIYWLRQESKFDSYVSVQLVGSVIEFAARSMLSLSDDLSNEDKLLQ